MPFPSTALTVQIRDVEKGRVKTFNCNTQAAKYLNISVWTIRSYKRVKLYKGKYPILACNLSVCEGKGKKRINNISFIILKYTGFFQNIY